MASDYIAVMLGGLSEGLGYELSRQGMWLLVPGWLGQLTAVRGLGVLAHLGVLELLGALDH